MNFAKSLSALVFTLAVAPLSLVCKASAVQIPTGNSSSAAISEVGRRVVLRWPVPALYPEATLGGLVCVQSGQAPLQLSLVTNNGTVRTLESEQISPLCTAIRNFSPESSDSFRLRVTLEFNDHTEFMVFPELGPRTDRFDFFAVSDRDSSGVLQLIESYKRGETHTGVICTNTLGKLVKLQLKHQSSAVSVPVKFVARADGCFGLSDLVFNKIGQWNLEAKLNSKESFLFTIDAE